MNIWLVSNSTLGSTTENALQLIGLIVMFGFVLAATYFTSRFVGNYKLGQLKNKNFKVIETYKIAPNKFLQLVKMGEKYVVISIGKDDVRFITELKEETILLPLEGNQPEKKFSDFIAKVQGKHRTTNDKDNDTDLDEFHLQ